MIRAFYSATDIAQAAGVSLHTVRDVVAAGKLNPMNLLELSSFVISHRLRKNYEIGQEPPVGVPSEAKQ
jgi:hypothetical protein